MLQLKGRVSGWGCIRLNKQRAEGCATKGNEYNGIAVSIGRQAALWGRLLTARLQVRQKKSLPATPRGFAS